MRTVSALHSMRWLALGSWSRRLNAFNALSALGLLSLCLAGCSSSLSPLPPLRSLHLPGVVELNAVAELEAKTGDHTIASLLTYRRTSETATHILYLGGSALYDIHLDGSGLRRISMQPPCYFLGAVDAGGEHGLCWNAGGVQTFELNDTASSWAPHVLVPASFTPNDALISPTIAPDGQHFAALHSVGSALAGTIDIYATDHAFTTAALVATITLSGLHARRLVWSPDGKWLAFTSDESTPSSVAGATYAFPLASILPNFPRQGSPPRQVALDKAHLTILEESTNETNAWRPSGSGGPTWTYVASGAIWQVDVATGQRTNVLAVPDGGICALSWTSDGKQLIFAQCRVNGASYPPPARLYVYTPPAALSR